jgi:beta-xylosidase
MYYTTRDIASGYQCISVAVSASPSGPYVDSSKAALACQVSGSQRLCGSIDPSPFVDTNGTAYLIWKSDENNPACGSPSRLWSAPLSADGTALAASATQLLISDQPWQGGIIEAPAMILISGTYYLLYSASDFQSSGYSMGYATCSSPSGPCRNATVNAPFVATTGSAAGPGGGQFFEDSASGLWLVYHAWTAPLTSYLAGGVRSLRIDRLAVIGGTLSFQGPTTTPQPL